MNRGDIIRMAREAGCPNSMVFLAAYERLAAMAAAAERDACAALIENADLGGLAEYPGWQRYTADLLTGVAAAIRARGQA
jgi:hypothetical protein